MGIIDNLNVSSGAIKIKIDENSCPSRITHLDDFNVHFPEIDLPTPRETSQFKIFNIQ